MALPAREQTIYWGIAGAVFLFFLWWLSDVILPFVLGAAIAYILNPVVDRIQRLGINRVVVVVILTILGLFVFTALSLLVIPTLISQAVSLVERIATIIENAPTTVDAVQAYVEENFPLLVERVPDAGNLEQVMAEASGNITTAIRERAGTLVQGALASVTGIVNVLLLFLIAPIVSFYLLIDWKRMVTKIDSLLPREHAPTIRRLANEIDGTLASFVRGQGLVCLILGTYYAVALGLVGLQFGFVVGALAGVLTFIPYVGALVGGLLSIGLALFQFWGDWIWIVAVWAIFQSGQFVEGNFLTPKLVGDSVGLHPVWLLFALSAFGALFGFVGLLVAVPVAAAMGVIARFLTRRYRESSLYLGRTGDP